MAMRDRMTRGYYRTDWGIVWDTVGPVRRLDGLDLRAVQMQMTRKEEVVSKGTGTACLGNPLNAMATHSRPPVGSSR